MYTKAAAIARMLYVSKKKCIGVGTLRSRFGKKQRRGVQPPIFSRASGKIIREILKQFESVKYVEKLSSDPDEPQKYVGRTLSSEGVQQLDKIAAGIVKGNK